MSKELQPINTPTEYKVEKIIKRDKRRRGVREALVKWKGLAPHHSIRGSRRPICEICEK